ncbi:diacylglycerol kinase family protein [Vagococcus vulneris]|nr:diacylglycerol kinase family protein [Vagococcus vulneris]
MDLNDNNHFKNRFFFQSVKHALAGIVTVIKAERNMRYHLFISLIVIVLCTFLRISLVEWCIIIGCLSAVLTSEMLNTAIETTVDLATNGQHHILAKRAKDIAAGGVLVTSIGALIIGLIILVPKLLNRLFY